LSFRVIVVFAVCQGCIVIIIWVPVRTAAELEGCLFLRVIILLFDDLVLFFFTLLSIQGRLWLLFSMRHLFILHI
jgi:hypothetical protein